MVRALSIAVFALLLLVACAGADAEPGQGGNDVVIFGPVDDPATLSVEVADTDAERAQGLMGVEELAHDDGMAFVFDEPTETSFWMKDTLIPLSIAFVDAADRVVTILEMTPCVADPCPKYGATEPYVLAVEANEGWFDAHGVEVGDEARLQGSGGS